MANKAELCLILIANDSVAKLFYQSDLVFSPILTAAFMLSSLTVQLPTIS